MAHTTTLDVKAAFAALDAQCVVDDPTKFKQKLQIGSKAYKYLTRAENTGRFITATAAGGVTGGLAATAWYASLGTLAQIGVVLGVVNLPIALIGTVAVAGGVTTIIVSRKFRKNKEKCITETPNFINTPLDVLGAQIVGFFASIMVAVARADMKICSMEELAMQNYFIKEWGINPSYASCAIKAASSTPHLISETEISEGISKLAKTGDIKRDRVVDEIIRVITEVAESDGFLHPAERALINKLKEDITRA